MKTKNQFTTRKSYLPFVFAFLLMLTTNLFTYAQNSSPINLETISANNLERLDALASWQPNNKLLSSNMWIIPVQNERLLIVANPLQHVVGIIDLDKLKLIQTIDSETAIFHLAVSHNGKYIVLGDKDTIEIWNIDTAKELFRITPPTNDLQINSIDLSSQDNFLAYTTIDSTKTTSQDGIYIYDIAVGKTTIVLKHPSVKQVTFSTDGSSLISAGYDGSLRLWDLKTSQFQEIKQSDNSSVFQLSFVNSELLATGIDDDTQNRSLLEYWNLKNKQQIRLNDSRKYSDYLKEGVAKIRLNEYQDLQLWSVITNKDLALIKNENVEDLSAKENLLITLSYSDTSAIINFRELDTGELLYTISQPHLAQALFSSDGKNLILWGQEGYLEIWGVRKK